jgi:hypothetical protein
MPFGLETLVWTLAAGNIQPLFIWPSWLDSRGSFPRFAMNGYRAAKIRERARKTARLAAFCKAYIAHMGGTD